jgi:hypothetical protein
MRDIRIPPPSSREELSSVLVRSEYWFSSDSFLGSLLLDSILLYGLMIYMFFKTTAICNELRQGLTFFQTFRIHLKILGSVILRRIESCNVDPHIVGATVQSSVAWVSGVRKFASPDYDVALCVFLRSFFTL